MKRLAAGSLAVFVWAGSAPLHAQEPQFFRKDIVVAQQFGGGATGGPATVGDFNGDGRPDIAVCTACGPAVLLNTGGGNFSPPIRASGACGTVAGDFNGDGRLDLIAGKDLLPFRNAAASRVTCTSNGEPTDVAYAGPQGIPGVDQINVRAPVGRRDLGTVVCSIEGVAANPVWL